MSITSIVAGKLAARAVETTLLRDTEDGLRTPIERARERLARARSRAESLDTVERYGAIVAVLVGGATALGGRS